MNKTISTIDAALNAGIEATDAARDAFQRAAGLFDAIFHLAREANARHIVTLAREGGLLANDYADAAFDNCATLIRARDTAEDKRKGRAQKSDQGASHA